MLKNIVHRLLRHRHFWREVGFDELSELYVSSMLRMLAVTLLMFFVPFFMYENGYAITQIFATYGWFFVARAISDIGAGYIVARFGPKHTMIVSCLLQIASAAMFLSVPSYHWPIWALGGVWGMSASCYFVAYHVDFSKVKHLEHSGREIGYMQMMERAGAVVGPLLGGIVAALFGPQYIFLAAVIVLVASLWPLFRTSEPVKTHQKLDFKGLPVSNILSDLRAYASLGVENSLCVGLWALYLALFALSGQIYGQLGALSSVAVFASLISAHLIGKFIDVKSGRTLLRISAVANAAMYAVRPFVGNLPSAMAVNVANEAITTGYRMPFIKGMYAAADDLPGHRIVYVVSMECIASIVKATAWFMLSILAVLLEPRSVFLCGFLIAAAASLMVTTERFKALTPRGTIKAENHE